VRNANDGVRTFPSENALRGETWGGDRGRNGQTLIPSELDHTFRVLNYHAKFHCVIVTEGEMTDRQTDRHTHDSNILVHTMMCYTRNLFLTTASWSTPVF